MPQGMQLGLDQAILLTHREQPVESDVHTPLKTGWSGNVLLLQVHHGIDRMGTMLCGLL